MHSFILNIHFPVINFCMIFRRSGSMSIDFRDRLIFLDYSVKVSIVSGCS